MQLTNIHEAKTHLSRLLERVSQGEEIIIGRAGKPIAKLVPYQEEKKAQRKLGGWEGRIWMSEDFDETDPEILEMFYGDRSGLEVK